MNLILSVFVPDGIVLGTYSIDVYHEKHKEGESSSVIHVENGWPHSYILFEKYGMVFYGSALIGEKSLQHYLDEFQELYRNKEPSIEQLPQLLLNFIKDIKGANHLFYLAGYARNELGSLEPFVYSASLEGNSYSRININQNNKPISYFHTCGKSTVIEKLFNTVKVKQEETWVEIPPTPIRFEHFSIEKAHIFAELILRSTYLIENMNNISDLNAIPVEIISVKRNGSQYVNIKK
ncbi:MAG: hypothetical protein EGQ20_12855 [Bacteroides oleiciplenus]|nr:hypothetical protein [Bacteroides oleiciplenus]